MKSSEKFEQRLKEAVFMEANKIDPSEDMFMRIEAEIKNKNMGVVNMDTNKCRRTRGILIACLILVLTTVTCFAASKIVGYHSHSTNDTFMSFPSEKEVKRAGGFVPKYIEEFSNGYVFERGGVGETVADGEDGRAVMTVKEINFSYKNGKSLVDLTVSEQPFPDEESGGEKVALVNGIEGEYYSDMYKFLPSDYEMTEQDKADEASGKYIFSYGTEKVEIQHVQQIKWEDDGMVYALINFDDGVDKDGLAQMAGEVIGK
ncbi:MAG: hypothetical protein ACI4LO_09135 [Anaerovoracaceae bacterium]